MNEKGLLIFVLILAIGAAALQAGCAPAPPTGFGAEVQLGKVILTWDDNSDNEDGFRVYRRPYETSDFTKIATLAPNTTSYEDNAGLEKDYEYEVKSFNNNGESSSPIIRVKTAPKTPTNLKFTNPTEGEIVLSWTDNATVEEGYEIWQRAVGGENWSLLTNALPPNSTTFTYAGSDLYCAKNYEYKLATYVRNGDKVIYSEWIYITGNPCENWTFSTVEDMGEKTIKYTSIAVSGSAPHISYFYYYCPGPHDPRTCLEYNDLNYATNWGGSWETKTVDRVGIVGLYNSIAVSGSSVYVTSGTGDGALWLNKFKPSLEEWQAKVLDGAPTGMREQPLYIFTHTTLALGSDGSINVSYTGKDSGLIKYLKAKEAAPDPLNPDLVNIQDLDIQVVDSGGYSGYPSMALSGTVPYIAYTKDNNLMLAMKPTDSWQISIVDEGVGQCRPSIDARGSTAHIVYSDFFHKEGALKYATGIPGGWQIHTIDSLGTVAEDNWSIAAESSNIVHIVYEGPGGLKYATNKTGAWRIVNLDSVSIPEYSLDIALDGGVHVVYVSGSKLKYARGVSKNRPK